MYYLYILRSGEPREGRDEHGPVISSAPGVGGGAAPSAAGNCAHDEVSIGWEKAYYFPQECEIYLEDLNIRQAGDGGIIPIHKHKNTIRLWKSFERYLKRNFPDAKHITTPDQDTSYGNFKTLLRSLGYKKLNYTLFQKKLKMGMYQQKPR